MPRLSPHPLPSDRLPWRAAWRRRLTRSLLSALLLLAGVAFVPYHWCARQADAWFDGDAARQGKLAAGVEHWLTGPRSRADFSTGSRQFDGEWLFGTYMMAGMGFGQMAQEHPAQRQHYVELMGTCIERLMSPEVRAFDRETWGNDPLDTLDSESDHAAYLGYLNLVLSLHRQFAPQSKYAALNDRITAALTRRLERSSLLLLQSYPGEVYPVDNCAVIGSIALHARATGAPRPPFLDRWLARCRSDYIDRRTGLLLQCINPETGKAADLPRGSGTCLGLYFLSFADSAITHELFAAVHRELAGSVFGFGGIREYPRGTRGEYGDIDSGPVIFGYGLSATGFALSGSRICGERALFRRLYATAYLCGAPYEQAGRLNFVTGGPLGDAILFAMLTARPATDRAFPQSEKDSR